MLFRETNNRFTSCWPLSDSFSSHDGSVSDFKLQLNELVWIKEQTFLFQKHQFSQYKYLLVICSFTPKIKFHFSWYIRSNKFNFAHFKIVRALRWLDVYSYDKKKYKKVVIQNRENVYQHLNLFFVEFLMNSNTKQKMESKDTYYKNRIFQRITE